MVYLFHIFTWLSKKQFNCGTTSVEHSGEADWIRIREEFNNQRVNSGRLLENSVMTTAVYLFIFRARNII
jgi:hypothetical protein